MWDCYTSLHLAVAGERLVGVSALARELGRHSDHQTVGRLPPQGREGGAPGEAAGGGGAPPLQAQRAEKGVLGMLEDRLEQAVHREEGLFHLLMEEEAFKHFNVLFFSFSFFIKYTIQED